MDWDALQVFLTVARTGRISAAAKRLGVEHTTVVSVAMIWRTRASVVMLPPGRTRQPIFSAA